LKCLCLRLGFDIKNCSTLTFLFIVQTPLLHEACREGPRRLGNQSPPEERWNSASLGLQLLPPPRATPARRSPLPPCQRPRLLQSTAPPARGSARGVCCPSPIAKVLHLVWNHRITELRLEKTFKTPSPSVRLTLPSPPLSQAPEHHAYACPKSPQGRRLNSFPGQPVQRLTTLPVKEFFLTSNLNLPSTT